LEEIKTKGNFEWVGLVKKIETNYLKKKGKRAKGQNENGRF
jgi:hypothetical protein